MVSADERSMNCWFAKFNAKHVFNAIFTFSFDVCFFYSIYDVKCSQNLWLYAQESGHKTDLPISPIMFGWSEPFLHGKKNKRLVGRDDKNLFEYWHCSWL